MTQPAQKDIIRSLPGLRNARILRYGSIHKNIFLDIPSVCDRYQRDRKIPGLFYAGQICGVEGYVECIASGLVSALSVFADSFGRRLPPIPPDTMIGALMEYIHTPNRHFQPMNANMGLLPVEKKGRTGRKERHLRASQRAAASMQAFRDSHAWLYEIGPVPGSSH
jgi:methylenetetrahydrofolate--tRNA-(uracil-5-)-methyltransferase